MQQWRIVYPRSQRHLLDMALVWDYEESEYDIASRKCFDVESECLEYMQDLATKNGLTCPNQRKYLD
jgi:hypothetical protein